MTPNPHDAADRSDAAPRRLGLAVFVVALAPAVAAVWWFPAFVTQDGPAHLYNAHILARSFDPGSPFRDVFAVRWEPLPNWAGHVVLMGLVSALPPRAADRVMTTVTLVGFAAALVWLRWRVSGWRGMPFASAMSAMLALNVAWLFGFTSFLLGACLVPVTLGVWWSGRDGDRPARLAGRLAGLAVLGYFCHLVSLGLTAAGLVVLEALTPGRRRLARAAATAAGLAPLGPLAAVYLGLMRRGGGGLAPEWKHLADPLSPRAWVRQLSFVDPVALARRDVVPLLDGVASPWFAALAPTLWLASALGLAVASSWGRSRERGRLGWWVLAGLLLVAGASAPDTLGASHGEYLQLRVVLLGLAALVPVLRVERGARLAPLAALALGGAVAIQSAFVWDYARTSDRRAGAVLRAAGAVGTRRRVVLMLSDIRTRFRANPLLHADGLLGVGTANVLWGDYETRFYYFPVRFRDGLDRPDPWELEQIALGGPSGDRARRWARLLERSHGAIDVVVVWGVDPALDAATARRFRVTSEGGAVRVYRPRPVTSPASGRR